MGQKQSHKQLAKFLEYILGRKPDEFGLVPDSDGFFKLKDFFMALHEEEGWRHVRQPLINELILSMPDPPVEIQDNRIRATDRSHLPKIQHAVEIPKLLYTTVTPKSHSAILENGIFPTRHEFIILSSDKSMALRIGRRRASSPVSITVNVQLAEQQDIYFKQAGGSLYLTDHLPPECFSAPPLPKERIETKKPKKDPKPEPPKTPGSYTVDFENKKGKSKKSHKGKDDSWKRNKKRLRKQKDEQWPFD